MKDGELSDLLRSFDDKLAQADILNLKLVEELNIQKSLLALKDLNSNRVVELVTGIIVSVILCSFLVDNRNSRNLVISAGILLFFTFVSILGCIRQLILISRFDYSQSVAENQVTLISMRSYHIQHLRLAILQFPFYLAYVLIGFKVFFGVEIWQTGDRNWLISNFVIGLLLAPFSFWIYRSIAVENLNTKWIRRLYELSGGEQITKAIEFLDAVETK